MGTKKPHRDDLAPVDWAGIEPHFKAGILSLNAIAKRFSVSRQAIVKHAAKQQPPWERDLRPAIQAEAARLVTKQTARNQLPVPVTPEQEAAKAQSDREIVDENARVLAAVQIGHRTDIASLRSIVATLMEELATVINDPALFARAHMALHEPGEEALNDLREMAHLVANLPARVKVAKDLADALHKVVGMEREAFGLDTAGGTDGLVKVKVIDFTGKGDPDGAPPEDRVNPVDED